MSQADEASLEELEIIYELAGERKLIDEAIDQLIAWVDGTLDFGPFGNMTPVQFVIEFLRDQPPRGIKN